MKTKRFIEFILLPVLLVLSGCTQIREKAEQLMWEHSGVTEDFSYIQYQQMDAANALDEDGLYHSAELETVFKAGNDGRASLFAPGRNAAVAFSEITVPLKVSRKSST